jgi:hypothetical protein
MVPIIVFLVSVLVAKCCQINLGIMIALVHALAMENGLV